VVEYKKDKYKKVIIRKKKAFKIKSRERTVRKSNKETN